MNKTTQDMKSKNNILRTWLRGAAVAALLLAGSGAAQAQVTIGGHVFGGGNKAPVGRGTTVLIDNDSAFIKGDVYGGGALAKVDTAISSLNPSPVPATSIDSTLVTIIRGNVWGNVYGGGLGQKNGLNGATSDIEANVYGGVHVSIGDTTIGASSVTISGNAFFGNHASLNDTTGNIFGCNNINGSPMKDVKVDIWQTGHTEDDVVGTFADTAAFVTYLGTAAAHSHAKFAIQGVYGGGNKASYTPIEKSTGVGYDISVYIHNCDNTVKMVYGGGRSADVGTTSPSRTSDTYITVDGGRIDTLFSGGDGHLKDGGGNYLSANIYGNTNTEVHGGFYTAIFGASNTSGTITGDKSVSIENDGPCSSTQDELIGSLFGGGNLADISGAVELTIGCGAGYFHELYGGSNKADIDGSVTLTVKGGTFDEVYGGSKGVRAPVDSIAADISSNVTLNLYGGKIGDAFGGSNACGNIGGSITVNVLDYEVSDCELDVTNIYGAGNLTSYRPTTPSITSPTVNVMHIKQTAGVRGNVFGGGKGVAGEDLATVKANPKVIIGYDNTTMSSLIPVDYPAGAASTFNTAPRAYVSGNVYGGGNAAKVTGTTTVLMHNGTVAHDVYGGGNLANVSGATDVDIDGGTVTQDVYGGGALANTGGANVALSGGTVRNLYGGGLGQADDPGVDGDQSIAASVTGAVQVTVNSGTVTDVFGCNNIHGAPTSTVRVDINNNVGGNVYGGGNQAAATVSPKVYLNSGTVAHNAFGGGYGETARITGDPEVNLVGGTVTGKLFGGGSAAPVTGDPTVNASYGTVDSVFGGGLGATAIVTGDPTVVVDKDPSNALTVVDVFGGGDAAGVTGNTNVTLTAGSISRAFGGGNVADITGTTSVTLQGATAANIYGGGNQASVSSTTIVTVSSGNATTGVYGGCNTTGNVGGDITVNVTGGTVGTSTSVRANGVFGGGYGSSTTTDGNVTVNIASNAAVSGPTIYGDIYGGSALGQVSASGLLTQVNFYKGTVNGDVYGGGLGDDSHPAEVSGDVEVNIRGGVFNAANGTAGGGMVFGANNANGTPMGDVAVNIYGTDHGSGITNNEYPLPYGTITTASALATNAATQTYAIAAVYGGGNLASYTPDASKSATVHVYNCNNTIKDVYGGGNAANVGTSSVSTNTSVVIDGGRIHRVFGGGNGEVTPANTYGTATTTVNAGLIDQVFGCGNMQGSITATDLQLLKTGSCTDEVWGEVFGGANMAVISSDLSTTIGCGVGNIGDFYGGSNKASITGDVTLTIMGGTFANVFGGSKGIRGNGSTIEDTAANITGNVTLNLHGGTIGNAFGGSNQMGNITGGITVNVLDFNTTCPLNVTNIYGGGNETPYTPTDASITSPVVNVMHIAQSGGILGSVYGGGKGATAIVTANPKVTIGYDASTMSGYTDGHTVNADTLVAYVTGNVFGGGDAAEVSGNTTVIMQKNNSHTAALFGGGNVAVVTGNTSVTMDNGTTANVYGGGNQAGVTGTTSVTLADGTVSTGLYGGCNTSGTVGGNITVALNGGTVGAAASGTPGDPGYIAEQRADVFGGGYGHITYTGGNVSVTLDGATIYGDLYGGSALGSVNANTSNTTTVTLSSNGLHGTVFGGGMGSGTGSSTQATTLGNIVVNYNTANSAITGIYGGANVNGDVSGNIAVNIEANVGSSSVGDSLDIFGGGKGHYTSTGANVTVTVGNSTTPTIYGDIYGGSEEGEVGATGKIAKVDFKAGTLSGTIFGGGKGQNTPPAITAEVSGGTEVAIATGSSISGGIYGGANINGTVAEDITVNVNGGTIGANGSPASVFGGGYGNNTSTQGDVTVNINGAGAIVWGDVYGGSGFGNVNNAAADSTTVNILNGEVKGNIFGGGLGDTTSLGVGHYNYAAKEYGAVTVNIGKVNPDYDSEDPLSEPYLGSATIGGNVYGCNNTYGSPQDTVVVNIYKTAHTTTPTDNTYSGTAYAIRNVFGGGKKADYTASKRATVNVYTCDNTIDTLYGGGDAAAVTGSKVVINGGRFNYVFGGGNGAGAGNPGADIGSLGITLDLHGGTIGTLVSASNEKGHIDGSINVNVDHSSSCDEEVTDFFGGANMVDIATDVTTTIECGAGTFRNVYGGSNKADIDGNVTLNIQGGTIGRVFGGSKGTAGKAADIRGNVLLNLQGGTIGCAFGGSNINGDITGTITVNVENQGGTCPLAIDSVFGAGNLTAYKGSPAVNIKHGTVGNLVDGVVFGGGKGATAVVTGSPVVNIGDNNAAHRAIVTGSVFGGGDEAAVTGNTTVNYNDNNADSYVAKLYGGGNNIVTNGVSGNTQVTLTAGRVTRGIYGGCNEDGTVGGNTTVNLYGGQVGASAARAEIFGGGFGQSTEVTGNVQVTMGNAAGTYTPIIYGELYGGSALGNVNTDSTNTTIVNILSGTLNGDIYGGGRGRKQVGTSGDEGYVAPVKALVNGVVHVNVGDDDYNGTANLRGATIYGCNNYNGSPQHDVYVDIYKTAHTITDSANYSGDDRDFAINYVYGGGNQANYAPAYIYRRNISGLDSAATFHSIKKVHVSVHGCDNTIYEAYGGGNAAAVLGDSVVFDGGRHSIIFGGGNGAVTAANVDIGGVSLTAKGGHVGWIYEHCNKRGIILGPTTFDTASYTGSIGACNGGVLKVDYHFCGGNEVDIAGDFVYKFTCSQNLDYDALYGGCRLGTTYGNITLIIEGGTYNKIYGGPRGDKGFAASVKKYPTDAQLEVDYVKDGSGNYISDETYKYQLKPEDQLVYPKGVHEYMKGVDNSLKGTGGNVTVILRGGTIGRIYGGCELNGNVEGKITVVVDSIGLCPLDVNYIYGASDLAEYHPDDSTWNSPLIMLQRGHVNNDIFAGGRGIDTVINAGLVTSCPKIIMGGQKIDTTSLITSHTQSLTSTDDLGYNKFWVKGNIYGGGEMASVGKYTRAVNGNPTACDANTGRTTIAISSGKVGPATLVMPTFKGHVFGGSKGAVGDTSTTTGNPKISHLAYVNTSDVTISGTAFIKGSVYGGGESGRIFDSTYVKIEGGQIGCGWNEAAADDAHRDLDSVYTDAEWLYDVTSDNTKFLYECNHWPFGNPSTGKYDPYDPYEHPAAYDGHTFYGNVFGGGSGMLPYKSRNKANTADSSIYIASSGRVRGNTRLEITGGHILTSAYGGCELGDVTGNSCTVIFGGTATLGVPRTLAQIAAHPVTCYLFGAGKGDERVRFNKNTNVQNVHVTVNGGKIYGSIFGGGEDGHVMRNVKVDVLTGANIGTWGTSYVDGNVFGGGRGFSGNALTAGNVAGDVEVNIKGGTMLGSIYGGGRLASVGYGLYLVTEEGYGIMRDDNKDDLGNTVPNFPRGHITVNISGGTIGNDNVNISDALDYTSAHPYGGNVFGGSMGRLTKMDGSYILDLWNRLGCAKQTEVNISGTAWVKGNVYGGSELGTVTENTTVNITGADVRIGRDESGTLYHGEVYGGGYGSVELTSEQLADQARRDSVPVYSGRTYGSTELNLTNGTIYGSVFGGGERASIGSENDATKGNTTVNIGAAPVPPSTAYTGDVTIHGNVYGANNFSGTPLGNVNVNIYSTNRTAKQLASYTSADKEYAIANVFGGGHEADYSPSLDEGSTSSKRATVHVYGCDNTIEDLFSGGDAAAAYGVGAIIDGGRFSRVFGGGNGEVTTADIGAGGTNTIINGGKIHQLFGGSNMQGTLAGPVRTTLTHNGSCPEQIDEFYAGSNEAPIVGDIITTVECAHPNVVDVNEFYGGCNLTDIYGNVTLIVNGGSFGRLFGGSKGSNSKAANIYRLPSSADLATDAARAEESRVYPPAVHSFLAAHPEKCEYGGNVNLYIYGGTIGRAFGGSDVNGNIEGAINVYVNDTSTNCPLDLDYVYGGGDMATNIATDGTITSPYVHLLNGVVDSNVYGGGRGTLDNIEKGRTTANAKVEMNPTGDQHFWVKGNIYGGGELAYVGGNDTVIINGGKVGPYAPADGTTRYTLKGCVYGGGLGKPGRTYANFARVGGNTVVSIGANTDTIHGSVFGGGEDGQVLGNTSVTVAGGVIGVPTKYTDDLSELNTYVGNVYGGGRGIDLDASDSLTATAGMVGGNTAVTISGGHVCRSVYGGGSIASVGRDGGVGFKPFDNTKGGTSVTVTGGLIGVYAAPTDNGANANPRYTVNPNATYGSVYGGGRGLPGTSLDGKNNYTNMAYVNNTAVTINYSSVDDSPSGTNHIVGNVYGGADNGSVNNSTSVTITGGRIGSDGNKDFGSLDGNVFGGGRGEDTYRTYRIDPQGRYLDATGAVLPNQSDPAVRYVVDTISPFAGGTYGNTSVLINGETRNSVQVMHHVYGGGANASVGDYDRAAAAVGSGLDETLAKGEVYLLTNANSPSTHPAATDTAGTCKVTVTGGTIGTSGRNNGMIFGASRGDIGAPGSIYDSIAYVNKTIVTIGGGTNSSTDLNDFNPLITGSIYGGGENGHTVADAYVYIHDGRVGNHGDMYDRTKTLEDSIETLQKWVREHSEDAHKDDTLAKIEAFTTEMNSKLDFLSLCGNIYGGGCGTDKYIDIKDDNKEKYNSFAGVVFGNATILMDGGYVERNIYGGGAMANLGRRVGAYVEHTDPETTFALSWPAEIHCRKNTGVARVTVSGSARLGYSGKDNGDIFGASRGEAGEPLSMTKIANVDSTVVLVNITDHAGKTDIQYYGDPATGQLGVNPKNDHSTPLVAGSVYGGAENGHVIRSTNVRMQAGIVGHSIYGGGKGKGTYKTNLWKHTTTDHTQPFDSLDVSVYSLTAGRVYHNTYVTMTGGRVIRSVYGGGNMASVGKGNYAGGPGAWQNRGYGEKWPAANSFLIDTLANSGHTLVYITGGTIGILNPSKPKDSFKDDLPLGNVFGGCRGEAAPAATATQTPRYYYSPGYFSGYTNHTRVIIGDSTVSPVTTPTATSPRLYGSVYGGGQDGHVRNKTVVIINDAEIGVPYVSPSEANTLVGVNDISDMHWLGRGNVFGAGSGIGQYDSDGDGEADTYNDASGSVTDSTLIVINGGLIHQNVYGGGALASIGPMILPLDADKTPDSTWSMARVFVKGGTIGTAGDCSGMYIVGTDTTVFGHYGGNVYGAGHGLSDDAYKTFNNTHHTHVHASGGTINGDVYGGAEDGHVISHTWVDINGTVTIGYNGLDNFNGNIFGGGRGSGRFTTPGDTSTYTMNVTCGRVGGNTNLTVDGNAVILGSLFGGGRTALTGVNEDGELDATFFTAGNYDSVNHGYAYVTVKGSPKIGNPDSVGLLATDYSVGDIFGSGKGDIECYNDVRAGRVMNASVHISQTPRIYGAIFGGGEMAGVGWWDNTNLYTPLACGFAPKTGTTKVTLTGCDTIGTHYEYTQPYLADHGDWTVVVDGKLTHACTGNIVGASQGDVDPESPHWISMGRSRQSYVDISGTGTIMGNVYGGAEQGVVLENTDVRVSGCTIGTLITGVPTSIAPDGQYYFGSVFGGGYGREETELHFNDSCIVVNKGTELVPVYDTTFVEATLIAGRVYGNTNVLISDSATVRENVYGGGNMASVGYVEEDANHKYDLIDSTIRHGGLCTVKITGGLIGPTDHTQMNGSVYGGGKGVGNDPDEYFKNYCNVHNTDLTVSGGHIHGSTFGGGADCHVLGNTRTTIQLGAYIGSGEDTQEYDGCVFGGGRNAQNINHTAGRVQGHTYITMTGGRVRRSILGGGALARTGVDTNGLVDAFVTMVGGIPSYDSTNHGSTFIYVTGPGTAAGSGADTVLVTGVPQKVYANDSVETSPGSGVYIDLYVDSTGFSVADSATYKDYLGTTRTTDDGNIVVYYTAIGAYNGAVLVDNDYTIGDIFGGGKGDTKDTVDIMAGRVMNTHVHITGSPRIMADVYAGAEMGSVGWWDTNRYVGIYGSSAENTLHDVYYTNTGYTKLVIDDNPYTGTPYEFSSPNIHGGRSWTLIDSLGRLYHTCSGNIYGGGQGYVEQDGTHYWNWVHMGRVRNTSVRVNGGRFMGNAFGGGARGVVKEDCHVTITGGRFGNIIYDSVPGFKKTYYYYGSVFGGGYGNHKRFKHYNDSCFLSDTGRVQMVPTEQAGRVYGNTYVNITGGQIMDCVYGGGDMASTGWVERRQSDGAFLYTEPGKRHGGKCYVNISGSTIVGPLDYNGHNAYVYAAGRGIGHDPIEYSKKFCNVNEAHLTVELTTSGAASKTPAEWKQASDGGRIWGSLFGGGADSHVLDSVSVVVHSGVVGTQGTTSYDGNIFGGGRNYLNTNHTNGRVQGNIRVFVDGGTLQGTIFGGGRLAMSGVDVDGHFIDSTYGNVDILVRGNATIGNSNGDSLLWADESCGDIFGSGKGDIKNYEDVWAGRVTNAKITVKDTVISGNTYSPRIYGSIFGGGEMASLGYWDDTIRDGDDVVFYTTSDEGTNYGVMYENTGRAVINLLSNGLILGSDLEYTVAPHDNPGSWTIYESTATDTTLIHTCTGNVFGGSQGDVDPSAPRWVSMGRSGSSVVNISGGTFMGNVYGGAEQGIVTGDTRLSITGGTFGIGGIDTIHVNPHVDSYYSGDIYAAGYGCDDPNDAANLTVELDANDDTVWASPGVPSMVTGPDNDSIGNRAPGLSDMPDVLAGRTYGNARVDITGGHIHGSVYGGGSFASVGYEKSSAKGNTLVNIGLPGPSAAKAAPDTVIGNATIDGEVFGANNFSGTPYGNTEVHIYKTAHTAIDTAPMAAYTKTLVAPTDELTEADVEALPTDAEYFALKAVYGGGNKAAHTPVANNGTTLVHIHYCEENTVRDVYGGGNAASTQNTHILIEGGRIYEVFGGGNGAGDDNPGADVTGTAWTEIKGGLITDVFGGSNSKGNIGNTQLDIAPDTVNCDIMVANTYGGGNEAEGGGGVINLLCGTNIGSFYGGSRNANLVGDVVLNVYGGTYENIFGGSQGTPEKPADITGNVTVNFYGGNVQRLFGGSDVNGNITGTVLVNVDIDPYYKCDDGLRLDTVYGGGHDAAYTPYDPFRASPTVNIMNNRYYTFDGTPGTLTDSAYVHIIDVFGGGLGATATVTSYPRVVIGGFGNGSKVFNEGSAEETTVPYTRDVHIYGNAYGGGSLAPTHGNTVVYVRDAVIGEAEQQFTSGNLFGGGYGTSSKVTGDTYVGVFGLSDIKGSVYGGGNAGIVTGNTEVVLGYQPQILPPEFVAYLDTVDKGLPTQRIRVMGGFHNTTPGVYFRYTKDGTIPTTSDGNLITDDILSPTHDKANDFEFDWNDSIYMIAYLWDEANSKVDSSMIPSIVGFDRSTQPTISFKDGGTDPDSAIFNGTIGARVYYTLDGSTPTTSSTLWGVTGETPGSPVAIGENDVVKAFAWQRGCFNSGVSFLTADHPTVDNGDNTATFTITAKPGERIIYTVGTTDTPTPISLMNQGQRPGTGPGETGMVESTDDAPGHTATASAGSTVTHKKRVYTDSKGQEKTYRWSEVTAATSGATTVTITVPGGSDYTVKAIVEHAGYVPSNIGAAVYRH